MLEIRNKTPFNTLLVPSLDKQGYNYAVIIIKGTFTIHQRGAALVIADEQLPPQQSDIFYGAPGKSSVRYESDIAPIKREADIILNGHAYVPAAHPATSVDASLQIGSYKKSIKAIGDRVWQKHNFQWQHSSPQKFERMPLVYENAFGGIAQQIGQDNSNIEFCAYNPIGKGFVGAKGQGLIEGLALPNVENPTQLIQYWDDCPMPVGFGFIGRNWQPRLDYAGTYDQLWKQDRMPLLPLNFDERYYNGTHSDAISSNTMSLNTLAAGEEVIANNLSESGYLKFTLPRYRFIATAKIKGETTAYTPVMDTLIIEPDELRVLITWRVAIPCTNQFLYIDNVTVNWRPI
jgi:hypothetical protein